MKQLTEEQFRAHRNATYRGALEGAAVSGAIGGLGLALANRRLPQIRALPPTIKTLGIIILVAPCLSIQAERRGLEYDHSQWEGESVEIMKHHQQLHAERWERLTMSAKALDWFRNHQMTSVAGAWALSMVGSGILVARQRGSTPVQKLVQVRMYAQAITIALLIGVGVLTQSIEQITLWIPAIILGDKYWQSEKRKLDSTELVLLIPILYMSRYSNEALTRARYPTDYTYITHKNQSASC
ncbi:hypothetical protein DL96DRAFT_1550978 [Flagelloscypha sp. PMI_526]|nr:hypothetical protein DL96DRAFT_1550978 [Flagelloscypha sp. PMI_526]